MVQRISSGPQNCQIGAFLFWYDSPQTIVCNINEIMSQAANIYVCRRCDVTNSNASLVGILHTEVKISVQNVETDDRIYFHQDIIDQKGPELPFRMKEKSIHLYFFHLMYDLIICTMIIALSFSYNNSTIFFSFQSTVPATFETAFAHVGLGWGVIINGGCTLHTFVEFGIPPKLLGQFTRSTTYQASFDFRIEIHKIRYKKKPY